MLVHSQSGARSLNLMVMLLFTVQKTVTVDAPVHAAARTDTRTAQNEYTLHGAQVNLFFLSFQARAAAAQSPEEANTARNASARPQPLKKEKKNITCRDTVGPRLHR